MLSHDHGHPVLFLRGVNHENLQYIVEFIYSGQVSLPEERVKHFIDSAQDLGISSMEKQDKTKKSEAMLQHLRHTDNWTHESTSTPTKELSSSNYQKSEKVEPAEEPKLKSEGAFSCKVCDYKTKENSQLMIHVGRNHTKSKYSSIIPVESAHTQMLGKIDWKCTALKAINKNNVNLNCKRIYFSKVYMCLSER